MVTQIQAIYDPLLPTLLVSIHKEYVEQIKTGQKIIEYRKSFLKDAFQAFIYTSGKNGGVELFIKCAPAIVADADKLAQIGQLIQKDSYTEIYDYFQAKNTGCLLPIEAVAICDKVSLADLRQILPSISIPQKYLFLDHPDKQELLHALLTKPVTKQFSNNWETHFATIKKHLS